MLSFLKRMEVKELIVQSLLHIYENLGNLAPEPGDEPMIAEIQTSCLGMATVVFKIKSTSSKKRANDDESSPSAPSSSAPSSSTSKPQVVETATNAWSTQSKKHKAPPTKPAPSHEVPQTSAHQRTRYPVQQGHLVSFSFQSSYDALVNSGVKTKGTVSNQKPEDIKQMLCTANKNRGGNSSFFEKDVSRILENSKQGTHLRKSDGTRLASALGAILFITDHTDDSTNAYYGSMNVITAHGLNIVHLMYMGEGLYRPIAHRGQKTRTPWKSGKPAEAGAKPTSAGTKPAEASAKSADTTAKTAETAAKPSEAAAKPEAAVEPTVVTARAPQESDSKHTNEKKTEGEKTQKMDVCEEETASKAGENLDDEGKTTPSALAQPQATQATVSVSEAELKEEKPAGKKSRSNSNTVSATTPYKTRSESAKQAEVVPDSESESRTGTKRDREATPSTPLVSEKNKAVDVDSDEAVFKDVYELLSEDDFKDTFREEDVSRKDGHCGFDAATHAFGENDNDQRALFIKGRAHLIYAMKLHGVNINNMKLPDAIESLKKKNIQDDILKRYMKNTEILIHRIEVLFNVEGNDACESREKLVETYWATDADILLFAHLRNVSIVVAKWQDVSINSSKRGWLLTRLSPTTGKKTEKDVYLKIKNNHFTNLFLKNTTVKPSEEIIY